MTPHILCLDGYNLMHRARGGFNKGDYAVCFNFFRGLRALVEQFAPTRIIFAIEGVPVDRLAKFEGYKANRPRELTPGELSVLVVSDEERQKLVKKSEELRSFYRQKDLILDVLKRCFPISMVRHPNHEADDVIYNLIRNASSAVPWTVVSNDSDFTQLLNEFDHVKVYDPMQKTYVEKPAYDYVDWKSMRGDGSDNIAGIPGVGDKTALALINDPAKRREFFDKHPEAEDIWANNFDLIKFFEFSDYELSNVESSSPVRDWSILKQRFEEWGFQSLLKDKTWDKYVATFDPLFGGV